MNYRKMIASLEAVVENETTVETRPVTDNIMASVPVKTEVQNEQPAKLDEVVVETNPTDVNIDTLSSDLEPANDQGAQINQDLDDLEMVNSALEAYHTILKKSMGQHGILDRQVMLAVNHSLECFGLNPITNRFVSLEAEEYSSTALVSKQAASNDYIGRLGDKISDTGRRIAEAFRKFIEWIQNFYRTWLRGIGSTKDKVKELLVKAEKTKEFKPVKIASPRALCIGNEFVLNNEAEFDRTLNIYYGAIKFVTEDGPQAARQYNGNVSNLIKGQDVDEAFKMLAGINHTLYSNIESSRLYKQLDQGRDELDLEGEYVVSGPAAGNYRFYMETRGYKDVPYIQIGFKEQSGLDVPHEVEFLPDRQRVTHILKNLLKGYDEFGTKFYTMDHTERSTVKSMLPLGNSFVELYVKTLRGLFGSVTDVVGQYDRFGLAVCKVIEKSIVE